MQLSLFYNYIGIFLVMRCNYRCSYCINWKNKYTERDGKYWVKNLNKLETNLPITFGGGEPSLHKDFYYILKNLKHKVHLLTNLSFDPQLLIDNNINLDMFDNEKSFAPIRVSFHSEFMDKDIVLEKMRFLKEHGFRAALYCVETKQNIKAIKFFKSQEWLDFQTKPLLDNIIKQAQNTKKVLCRTKELLVAPDGKIYRCHRDLYKKDGFVGTLDTIKEISYIFGECYHGNECHPCDLKIKRDRFGKEGYCAIEKKI